MKKALALTLAIALAFSLIGCGGGGGGGTALDQASSAAATTTAAATTAAAAEAETTAADAGGAAAETTKAAETTTAAPAPAEEAQTLAPYVIDKYELTNAVSGDVDLVMAEINKIIEPKFNATINIHMVTWSDWFTVVNTVLSAGEKADIVFTADWYQYTQSISNNYFLPLNDLMEQYARETMDQLGETFVKGSQFKGINYGVPTDKELAVNGGFLWNKTLADKYGLVPDPTWKSYRDWIPLLDVIKDNEPDVLPILADGNWYHMDWISYIGCDVGWNATHNDPTLLFLWEDPYYTDELYAARQMYLDGYIPKDAVSSDEEYNTRHLQMGDFFLTTQPLKPGKGKSTELMSQLITRGIEYDEFETTPLMVNTTHCGGSMLAIAQTSQDPARAMMFINEMHVNPDVTNLLAWGVEGVDYTVVQEANPKRVTPIDGNTWTSAMNGWMIGNFFNIYLSADEPEDKYDLLRATKEGIPGHVANGYRFDPEAWLDTITAVNNAMSEFTKNLRIGAIDPDEGLAGLIAAVDAAGFRPFFDAVKADFADWLSKK